MTKNLFGKRKIISASYQDYASLFRDSRTAFSELYAKKSAAENHLYIMIEDNFPAGYICANSERNILYVQYAYTVPERRRRGIFTSLLKHLIKLNKKSAIMVQSSTTDKNHLQTVADVCERLGFRRQPVCKTFCADWDSLCEWKEQIFDKFMSDKGGKYLEFFSAQEFTICSFADASTEHLAQLYHSHENYFGNKFDVRKYFDGYDKNLIVRDLSFIAVKDNEVAAYFLTIAPGKNSFIVDQTAVAKKYLGSGLIFPLLNAFVQKLYARQCKNLAFAVYENNFAAIKFYDKITRQLKTSNRYMYKFLLRK